MLDLQSERSKIVQQKWTLQNYFFTAICKSNLFLKNLNINQFYFSLYLYIFYFIFLMCDKYLLPPDQADSVKVGEPWIPYNSCNI